MLGTMPANKKLELRACLKTQPSVGAANFGAFRAGRAKAATPQTPSPHSKTWRRIVATLCLLVALFAQVSLLQAQPAVPNQVLELDGNGSYVELPPNIFNDLDEATVECWVKCERFYNWTRVFDFGEKVRSMNVTLAWDVPDLAFDISEGAAARHFIRVANLLQVNQWCHVAAVSGKGGMRL